MALFNYATKEITLKLVYYGPGLSGKTTNLKYLHDTMSPDKKGKLLSLATEADRTLFFDFMPVSLGKIRDFNVRFQLYTVPGQVRYNATRKLVLKGADAVVFVADSQEAMREQNAESFENMKENLVANNINPDDIPVVLQYNKRDLKAAMPVEALDSDLNRAGYRTVEAVAISGAGVEETFKLATRLLLSHISKKHNIQIEEPEAAGADFLPRAAAAAPVAAEVAPTPSVAPAASPEKPSPVSWGDVEFPSETEMEKELIEAALPEEEAIEIDEASADLTEKDWSELLESSGRQEPASFEAEHALPLEPAGWPGAEEAPVEAEAQEAEGPQGYKPFEVDEEEPLWAVDEGPVAEASPLAGVMEEAAVAFPEAAEEERPLREEAEAFGVAPSREAPQASVSTERLEEIMERVAQDTHGAVDALNDLPGIKAGLGRLSALDDLASAVNSTNDLLLKVLEELKEIKKHQADALLTSKKAEGALRAVAGAALESKKKGGFRLFGR